MRSGCAFEPSRIDECHIDDKFLHKSLSLSDELSTRISRAGHFPKGTNEMGV
ncbi:MAG: hypothetical protein IT422_17255 [Pirellulaceae bacterium]|nr:hypothetical protein [Pirellulaceae bacterium]